MLISQSLNDSRVPYWEAAKWVAKLRHLKTDDNPVILYIKMRGGHGGGSGRFDNLEDYARAYAFALGVAGGKEVRPLGKTFDTPTSRGSDPIRLRSGRDRRQKAVRREGLFQEADRIGCGSLGPRRRIEVCRHEQRADGKALPDLGRGLDAVPVADAGAHP